LLHFFTRWVRFIAGQNGETTLEALKTQWFASPSHKTRIERFFSDLIGVRFDLFLIPPEWTLKKSADGIYSLTLRSACTAENASDASAWWLEDGQTIKICNNAISDFLTKTTGNTTLDCRFFGESGLTNAQCGCGPNQILCFPEDLEPNLRKSVTGEIKKRGLYAYENGLSWKEYLAGDFLFADRLLSYYYMRTSAALSTDHLTAATATAYVRSFPLDAFVRGSFPPGRSARSGVVTSPAFLKQYNSFRSRVRSLSQNLLCQDISPLLNTDSFESFVNTSLTPADVSHATKSGCAGCHYPMDNHASALLGWETEGFFEFWKATPSQMAHAFNETGDGPTFLINSYIDRAPWFSTCMASRAFQSFKGSEFSSLSEADKNSLLVPAKQGPKELLLALFALKNMF
jgi:hypothetical protein